jgi:hypothetical protein
MHACVPTNPSCTNSIGAERSIDLLAAILAGTLAYGSEAWTFLARRGTDKDKGQTSRYVHGRRRKLRRLPAPPAFVPASQIDSHEPCPGNQIRHESQDA